MKMINPNREGMLCQTDPSFEVLQWEYRNSETGTDIIAERSGDVIYITGRHRNKKYKKKFRIDSEPWFQSLGLGLKAFAVSDEDSICFWLIDPCALKPAKFEATKEKTEKPDVDGQETESIYIKLSLTH
jgi:hypothetical protein